ncbi:MAG: DUF3160 domain-containing protein [Alphaproteobacteria bacterium]|nr:DUF3160 domain-containing protein [Alphaproteobacteria bacterium]MCB9697546.1 DUF3160 domain-containing protein [Alphaproteobacteria bacterium]
MVWWLTTVALAGKRGHRDTWRPTEEQRQQLHRDGVVILADRRYRSFGEAYEDIYVRDLPVFVTADSVLHAMHRTFDDTLATLEKERLEPDLRAAIEAMLSEADDDDVIAWLLVARDLLDRRPSTPLAQRAYDASGPADVGLFGKRIEVDLSLLTPRGHYVKQGLEGYFQAMSWIALVSPEPITDGRVSREGWEAAVALAELRSGAAKEPLDEIERVLGALLGPVDGPDAATLAGMLDPDVPATTILERLPVARIGSEQVFEGQRVVTVPLLAQRWMPGSDVLSSVVLPAVPDRRMPDPLDVGWGAWGNPTARALLAPEGDHATALDTVHDRLEALPTEVWTSSLTGRWLQALRSLSDPDRSAAPRSEAWSRRVLAAQLGSWTELRHDTILYARQPRTPKEMCAFPSAWVEPVPAFWAATGAFGDQAATLVRTLPLDPEVRDRLEAPQLELVHASGILRGMAERERAGEPFDRDQLAFVRQAVRQETVDAGCTSVTVDVAGWYPRLFPTHLDADAPDLLIADIHTQPTDELGRPVGRVLHVASGLPRWMAVEVQTCDGPGTFYGPVFDARQVITDGFERLTDADWARRARAREDPELPWLAPVVR